MIRLKPLLAALSALSLSLAALPALAGQAVALRPEPADENGRVTLGDLFEGAGDAAQVVVAAGRPGAGMVLDAGRVQIVAHAHGLEWDNSAGIRRLIVRAGAIAPPPSDPNTVVVKSRGTNAVEVLAYARSINTGEIIQPSDLMWSKSAVPGLDTPRDADSMIGMSARRPLREGAAVAQHDVTPPQVVKKDEMISLVYSSGGVTLTLQGKAMENAVAGQVIGVMNPESKKVVQAVAVGPGQAIVGPQADQLRAAARLNPSLLASIH